MHILAKLDPPKALEINGWAYDKTDLDRVIHVVIRINEVPIRETSTQIFRKRLMERGDHPTGNCGFQVRLEQPLNPGDVISVVEKETNVLLSELRMPSEEELNTDEERFFYMHIAKAGGTSLNNWAQETFGASEVRTHVEGHQQWENNRLHLDHKFISGHLRVLRAVELMDLSSFKLLTVLRQPLEHLASHLAWVKKIGVDQQSDFFKSHDPAIQKIAQALQEVDFSDGLALGAFIANGDDRCLDLFDNCQTRYFLSDRIEEGLSYQHLEIAVRTFQRFDVVATLEKLPSFIANLSSRLGQAPPEDIPHQNSNGDRFGLDLNDFLTVKALMPFVIYDQILYAMAQDQESNR